MALARFPGKCLAISLSKRANIKSLIVFSEVEFAENAPGEKGRLASMNRVRSGICDAVRGRAVQGPAEDRSPAADGK